MFKKIWSVIKRELGDALNGAVHFYYHTKRLFLLLITIIALGLSFDIMNIIKVSLVLPLLAAVVAHIVRKALFPKIDLSGLIDSLDTDVPGKALPKALVAVAMILFVTVITAIFCIKLL